MRNIFAVTIATNIPKKYIEKNAIAAYSRKNVDTNNTYIGNRAEHDINGLINIVMRRLLRLSIAREAMIAGTLQPKPITNGINDFPCNPMRCINLSIINAARAIYPESSINDIQKKSINIFGKKTITPPTPPITPSTTKSFNGPAGIMPSIAEDSQLTPNSIQCIGYAPTSKVAQKMANIISKNIGKPNSRLVTKASIIRVLRVTSFSFSVIVSANAPAINPYF